MTGFKRLAATLAVALPLAMAAGHASAEDQLKVAIGQINNWENQAPTLGQDAGIFKRHNLVLDNVGTQGAGETMQPVISGSADLGAGVGVAGVIRAFARGAPLRILLPAFTGTGDLFWYVRADSPLKTIKDVTANNTIAYSTSGSSSNNLVLAFADELGVKAKPTPTGGPPGTMTQVMSGQIDIGWSSAPVLLDKISSGEIRAIVQGDDAPDVREQTIRVDAVNANWLKAHRDVATRFMRAMWKSYEYTYSEQGMKDYSKMFDIKMDVVKAIPKYATLEAQAFWPIKGLDETMKEAVQTKRLKKPLTQSQLDDLIQVVYKPKLK
jgi:NitT/TauT family transport system substrate-binding protein